MTKARTNRSGPSSWGDLEALAFCEGPMVGLSQNQKRAGQCPKTGCQPKGLHIKCASCSHGLALRYWRPGQLPNEPSNPSVANCLPGQVLKWAAGSREDVDAHDPG